MTAHSRTQRVGVPGYYLGRPATFWLAAFGAAADDSQITPRVVVPPAKCAACLRTMHEVS